MDGSWRLLAVAGWCQSQWGCCTKNHHVSTLASSTSPWLPVCMEDDELLFTHDIMFASNVKVVPQQCGQYITQHIKDTILTSKEANFVSGLYHVFQFYYHSESSWWVFADKSKRSVLTTGHCGKLLATKATVRTFWFFLPTREFIVPLQQVVARWWQTSLWPVCDRGLINLTEYYYV